MPRLHLSLLSLLLFAPALWAACSSTPAPNSAATIPTVQVPSANPAPSSSAPAAHVESVTTPASAAATSSSAARAPQPANSTATPCPKCAICNPIKSTDACTSAVDCAPSTLCHAPSCIAKSKAPTAPAGGVMCTKNLVCQSIDTGRCDCLEGVCALVGR